MAFLLLFIGLLPIIFLPDVFGDGDDSIGNGTGEDDLDVLNPDDNDDNPDDFVTDVDDDTVIGPDEDDDDPDDFDHPVGDGDVLDPDEEDDAPEAASLGAGDGSLLQQFLAEQSDTAADEGGAQGDEYESGGDILYGVGDDVVTDDLGLPDDEITADHLEIGSDTDGEEDVLGISDSDDLLIFDKIETTTGDANNETYWLYHNSGAGADQAEISDFTPGEDFLRISLNPDVTSETPEVSVAPSEDGIDGIVTINGNVVVILQGAPDATLVDIHVDMPENIFR